MTLLARRIAARLALASGAAIPAFASAQTVVDFDVPPTELPAMRTALHGGVFDGIRWDGGSFWSVGDWSFPSLLGQLQCHSMSYCASPNQRNADGTGTGSFEFLSPARFFGLWVSGAPWADAPTYDGVGTIRNRVAAELWFEGALVHTTSFLDVTAAPQFLDAGASYAGLADRVRLIGRPTNVVIDDITFSAAPEPATFALAGTGLAIIALVRRRRRA